MSFLKRLAPLALSMTATYALLALFAPGHPFLFAGELGTLGSTALRSALWTVWSLSLLAYALALSFCIVAMGLMAWGTTLVPGKYPPHTLRSWLIRAMLAGCSHDNWKMTRWWHAGVLGAWSLILLVLPVTPRDMLAMALAGETGNAYWQAWAGGMAATTIPFLLNALLLLVMTEDNDTAVARRNADLARSRSGHGARQRS